MSEESIITSQQGAVCSIRINRPRKKNALTLDMYQGLIDALQQAANDQAVRVVVLSGEGDSFSSGNDIIDFVAAATKPDKVALPLTFLQTISTFSKPIIAAVQGDAIGIGTSMLLHCDLVYSAPKARFQLPFARLGLVPEGGTSLLLPSQLGHRLAFELLVLGHAIEGTRAAELGLINQVADEPFEKAMAIAEQLANMAPEAVGLSKKMLKQHQQDLLQRVLIEEVEQFAKRLSSAEAKEAFSAFIEKRPAKF
jgi:enoyl-CoA hydratase/carnithine racemase